MRYDKNRLASLVQLAEHRVLMYVIAGRRIRRRAGSAQKCVLYRAFGWLVVCWFFFGF